MPDAVLEKLQIESAFRTTEAQDIQISMDERLASDQISYQGIKLRNASARSIVRTGEATAYTNIGLLAGVEFRSDKSERRQGLEPKLSRARKHILTPS